jgi:predicted nucleotidyltransferase
MIELNVDPVNLERIQKILRQRIPDRSVWAFGSRVNGNARKYSDLDLVILGDVPLSLNQFFHIAEDFDESDIPFRIDLHDWNQIPAQFKPNITKQYVALQ